MRYLDVRNKQTNKQTNEVIIPSKKEKILRIKVSDKQLIDNSGDKSKYQPLDVVTALSNRDGYLNSYAEEMKNMNDDREKIFKRNNKNWPHTRLRDDPEKRHRQVKMRIEFMALNKRLDSYRI